MGLHSFRIKGGCLFLVKSHIFKSPSTLRKYIRNNYVGSLFANHGVPMVCIRVQFVS